MALMHGFCAPLSADPGQRIEFRISTTADAYTVTILRFRNHNSEEIDAEDIRAGLELDEEPILHSFVLPGKEQPPHTPDEACMDWDRAFMVDITDEWQSGLHPAKRVDDDDSDFYVVFIVNP